jgi:hypothetical protein
MRGGSSKVSPPSRENTGETRTVSSIGGRRMHKIFLAVSSMIVAGFLMKSWKKLHEKPDTKEEVYRRMKAEHEALRAAASPIIAKYRRMKAEHEALRAAARPTIATLDSISTPRDGAKMMAAIGTVQQMRDALRPSNDQCDAMAMAPGRFS